MKYDCLFVGNAIVDILTDVSFDFMNDQGIEPGSWRPVEKEEIEKLQSIIPDNKVASGGSAANSAVGFSFLGGSSAFIGSCLLYTSPSPRDLSTSRMPSSA